MRTHDLFFFVCSDHFFVCSVHFLFAAFTFLFAVITFLFAAFTFLFAAIVFCLQRFFFFAASPLWAIVIKRYALRLNWCTLCKQLPMNSKFVDFRGKFADNWNKANQPNNNEILEKKKNSYAQLPINKINKQEYDDICNFHFHEEVNI